MLHDTDRARRRVARLLAVLAAFALLQVGMAARAGAEPDVVGGDPAEPGEYPWQVALVDHGSTPQQGQFCGGSLIAADLVLTAAHCVQGARPQDIDVFAGEHDLRNPGELIRSASITVNPNFNSARLTSDLAVIHLAQPSTTGTPGRVIKASQGSLWEPGDLAWVTGWGATREGGPGSNVLLEAQVPIVSDADCQQAYGNDLVAAHHLCAGFLQDGGVDTCQGDSGGPMMVPNQRGQLFIVGLTSWGNGCARPHFPGVYTEVAHYLDWIRQQLRG